MIFIILLLLSIAGLFISYKMGEITGYREGYDDCEHIWENSINDHHQSIIKSIKDANDTK